MLKLKKTLCAALSLMLLLACAACQAHTDPVVNTNPTETTSSQPSPAETTAEPAAPIVVDSAASAPLKLVNGAYRLTLPEEYAELLLTQTEGLENGMLFSVSEKASVEAGEKNHPGEDWGAGWLFSIGAMTEAELNQALCYDMSGREVFAQDGNGTYYLIYHPTDVRIEREGDITDADMEQWSTLNNWAFEQVPAAFIAENAGLTAASRGNSELETWLNRAAWLEGETFTLTTLDYGTVTPDAASAAAHLPAILEGLTVEWQDGEAPDGEYLVMTFPEEDVRIDFFKGNHDVVRIVTGGSFETLYHCTYASGESLYDRMQAWYMEFN